MSDLDTDPAPDLRAPARRRNRRIMAALGAIAVTVGLWQCTTTLPSWMIGRAHKSAIDCTNALYTTGLGDPAECGDATRWLWLARFIPWRRSAALAQQAEVESIVADDQVTVASVRDLDAEARDAAARRAIALDEGDHPPQGSMYSTFGKLRSAGALGVMAGEGHRAVTETERRLALNAALQLGDWERAAAIAKQPIEPQEEARDWDAPLANAIVLCITGDKDAARTALKDASTAYATMMSGAFPEAHSVAMLCELDPGDLRDHFEHDHQRMLVQRVNTIFAGGETIGQDHQIHVSGADYAMAVALAVEGHVKHREDRPDPAIGMGRSSEVMGWIAPSYGRGVVPAVTWTRDGAVLGKRRHTVRVQVLEDAARHLVAGAELATKRVDDREWSLKRVNGEAARLPRETLLWGAYCLATHAATERIWRGQRKEALAALALAREIAARDDLGRYANLTTAMLIAGLVSAVDGDDAAVAAVADFSDDDFAGIGAVQQAHLRAQLAILHADAGKTELALAHARKGFDQARKLTPEPYAMDDLRGAAYWVHGELALAAGADSPLDTSSGDLRTDWETLDQVFGFWWNAALASDDLVAGYRWRSGGESHTSLLGIDDWYRSYVYALIARAAGDGDAETWLDAAVSDRFDDPLTYIRVRAHTAELLGNDSAATSWREREANLVAPLGDDRSAALYRLLP